MHDYQCADVTISGAKPLRLIWSLPKKNGWWTAQGFEWAAPAIESHQGWVSIIRCIYMHGAQVWIHQPLPSRFLLFEFCQEIENQVKSYNPPNAGLLRSIEVKWSSLQLISTDCYRGRCQLRSQNCRESVTYSSKRKLQNKLVSKNIFTRKQFFWMWFTTCCIWTSSHICDSQKCCVKKMGWHNEFQSPVRNTHQLTK